MSPVLASPTTGWTTGLNLVAKEFVSAREDDDGVLILSRFTGAARELREALLVSHPYDFDVTADAIRVALEMLPEERALRMSRMRSQVQEHNRWAGLLLEQKGDTSCSISSANCPKGFRGWSWRESWGSERWLSFS
jgi:trehalose-6-phosphate synthase